MKISIVIDFMDTDRAGTEGQVFKIMTGLAERHTLELIVLRRTHWIEQNAARFPWPVTILDLGSPFRSAFWKGGMELVRHFRQGRPDIVHTFFPIANIMGVLAARLAGVKGILSSRRDYGCWITPGYLKATRFANRFVDRIITNSGEVKRFTCETEGFPADRISVIYNGVDFKSLAFSAPNLALKKSLGIPDGVKVIALVANFRRIKRHDTLIEAAALLRQTHPDICLLFVGADSPDDPTLERVLGLAEAAGVRDLVFTGAADGNIADFLSIMDIGVNSSDSEGLSNAVIEYMYSKVPVVVSNGGGNPDLVPHEEMGLVFPVGDAKALSLCLARLLDDAELSERCVHNAYLKTQDMSLPAMLSRHEEAYQLALSH